MGFGKVMDGHYERTPPFVQLWSHFLSGKLHTRPTVHGINSKLQMSLPKKVTWKNKTYTEEGKKSRVLYTGLEKNRQCKY